MRRLFKPCGWCLSCQVRQSSVPRGTTPRNHVLTAGSKEVEPVFGRGAMAAPLPVAMGQSQRVAEPWQAKVLAATETMLAQSQW
jgi:hypothetical protein